MKGFLDFSCYPKTLLFVTFAFCGTQICVLVQSICGPHLIPALDLFSLSQNHSLVWVAVAVMDRVVQWRHQVIRRNGYLKFYRKMKNVRRIPLFVISLGKRERELAGRSWNRDRISLSLVAMVIGGNYAREFRCITFSLCCCSNFATSNSMHYLRPMLPKKNCVCYRSGTSAECQKYFARA